MQDRNQPASPRELIADPAPPTPTGARRSWRRPRQEASANVLYWRADEPLPAARRAGPDPAHLDDHAFGVRARDVLVGQLLGPLPRTGRVAASPLELVLPVVHGRGRHLPVPDAGAILLQIIGAIREKEQIASRPPRSPRPSPPSQPGALLARPPTRATDRARSCRSCWWGWRLFHRRWPAGSQACVPRRGALERREHPRGRYAELTGAPDDDAVSVTEGRRSTGAKTCLPVVSQDGATISRSTSTSRSIRRRRPLYTDDLASGHYKEILTATAAGLVVSSLADAGTLPDRYLISSNTDAGEEDPARHLHVRGGGILRAHRRHRVGDRSAAGAGEHRPLSLTLSPLRGARGILDLLPLPLAGEVRVEGPPTGGRRRARWRGTDGLNVRRAGVAVGEGERDLQALGGRGVGEAVEPFDGDGGAIEGVGQAQLRQLALVARCGRDPREPAARAPGAR